jgi:hypothetical protein
METHLGLTPEEMITVFNRMYLDVWEKTKDNISWELANISKQVQDGKQVDITGLLLQVLEVVITATRDGIVVAMYENNEKIYNDIRLAAQQHQAAAAGEGIANPAEAEFDEEMSPMDVRS